MASVFALANASRYANPGRRRRKQNLVICEDPTTPQLTPSRPPPKPAPRLATKTRKRQESNLSTLSENSINARPSPKRSKNAIANISNNDPQQEAPAIPIAPLTTTYRKTAHDMEHTRELTAAQRQQQNQQDKKARHVRKQRRDRQRGDTPPFHLLHLCCHLTLFVLHAI